MATAHEKLASSPENKQPTMKSIGVRYTFPFDVYPRYSYLQSWTARLVPRFRQKIEANAYQECVCDGYAGLDEITAAGKCLHKPTVTIFSKRKSPISDLHKSLVTTMVPFKYDRLVTCSMAWNDLVIEGNGSSDYDSRVLIVIAKDTDNDIFLKLSKLTQVQQESTLIYSPSTKSHRFYKKKRNSGLERMNSSRTLSQDIQTILELKVVTLLEKIALYMEPLVPREGQEPDKSLLDDITDQLKQFEICCLKDALALGEKSIGSECQPGDSQGRKPEAEETSRKRKRRKAINENLEYSSHSIEKISGSKKRKKTEPTKNAADTLFSKLLTEDEVKKLIELIGRRTKCQIVEHLSMERGIHPMVLATLLCSDKFYNFDSHYYSWISKHEIDKLDTAETILSKSETKIRYLVHDTADYVSSQYEHLEGIQKQQFELYGILRQSVFDVKVKLETKLNPELQDEILCLPEVTGCGTIFGILTLHTSKELPQSSKDNLKHLLQKYNYHRRYRVIVISSQNDQAGKFIRIESGSGLKAEICDTSMKKPSESFKYGTLGCFVNVKGKVSRAETESFAENLGKEASNVNLTTSNSTRKQVFFAVESGGHCTSKNGQSLFESCLSEQSQEISRSDDLHCITCQHCVSDCKDEIKTTEYGQESFAVRTSYFMDGGEKFDIALLRICEGRIDECNLKLPGKRELNAVDYALYPWRIFDNSTTLAARPVYKYGLKSKDTYGVIASDDYKEFSRIKDTLFCNKAEKYTDKERCMHPTVNLIIIGSDSRFSEDGDSGAVICDKDINDNVVIAISVLHGEVTERSKWYCTYSARLRDSLDELKRRFGIEIQVPTFHLSMNIETPFPAIGDLSDSLQSPEGDMDEPMADRGDMDEPMAERGDMDEPIANRGDMNEPMADRGDMDEPMADRGDMHEPMADRGDMDEPMAERGDMDEPIANRGDMNEPMADRGDMDEPMADRGDMHEPMADRGDMHEPMADRGDMHEPMADRGDTDEPVADRGDIDESLTGQEEPVVEEQRDRSEQTRREKVDQLGGEMEIGQGTYGIVEEEPKEQANAAKRCETGKASFKLNGLCSNAVDKTFVQGRQQNLRM